MSRSHVVRFGPNFNNHCYLFVGGPKTWEDAENFCRTTFTRLQPAHLVSIHNQDEGTFIYEMWKTSLVDGLDEDGFERIVNRANGLWIGMEDQDTEGSFKWSDDSQVDFGNWKPGQPDNWDWDGDEPLGEDCVNLWRSDGYVDKWNDAPCSYLMPFICKMPTE